MINIIIDYNNGELNVRFRSQEISLKWLLYNVYTAWLLFRQDKKIIDLMNPQKELYLQYFFLKLLHLYIEAHPQLKFLSQL